MVCSEFFHFLADSVGNNISRLKLVGKSLAVFIKQNCALSANAFADKKAPSAFFTVKRCGMNLNIIYILKLNVVHKRKRKGIARYMREIS